MLIHTEETPNNHALKFILGKPILDSNQTIDFTNKEAANMSPLALSLFDVEGVKRVFFGHNFIVVTKDEKVSWYGLKSALSAIIMDFLLMKRPVLDKISKINVIEMEVAPEDQAVVEQIKWILDTEIRPSVAKDGGDIIFYGYKDGCVYLRMQGSCQGCPSSAMTLKHGVEVILQRHLSEVITVKQVRI